MREVRKIPRVVYWNNLPAPYIVERLNALVSRGNLDVEAWFSHRTSSDRSWEVDEESWAFKYRYLMARGGVCRGLVQAKELLLNPPDVLVSLYAEPEYVLAWFAGRLRGQQHALWCVTTFDAWVTRSRWKDAVKSYMFRRATLVLTPGSDGRAFALRFGAPTSRVRYLPHAIDTEHFATQSRLSDERRTGLRSHLGLVGTTFLYVGRLWRGKGLPYLLDAFEYVSVNSAEPVSLLLVGDGPDVEELQTQIHQRGIRNIVLAGFVQKSDLPIYYGISDVFVFPTLGDPYGLVVDEAMACSLPIIATEAAGEIHARVEDGVNGYVVPSNESVALGERMLRLSEKHEERRRMGSNSYDRVRGRTPAWWAENFESLVLRTLGLDS